MPDLSVEDLWRYFDEQAPKGALYEKDIVDKGRWKYLITVPCDECDERHTVTGFVWDDDMQQLVIQTNWPDGVEIHAEPPVWTEEMGLGGT